MDKNLRHILKKIEQMKDNEVFEIKELFTKDEWSNLSRGERRNINYIFRNYIFQKDIKVKILMKNSRGSIIYKKDNKNEK